MSSPSPPSVTKQASPEAVPRRERIPRARRHWATIKNLHRAIFIIGNDPRSRTTKSVRSARDISKMNDWFTFRVRVTEQPQESVLIESNKPGVRVLVREEDDMWSLYIHTSLHTEDVVRQLEASLHESDIQLELQAVFFFNVIGVSAEAIAKIQDALNSSVGRGFINAAFLHKPSTLAVFVDGRVARTPEPVPELFSVSLAFDENAYPFSAATTGDDSSGLKFGIYGMWCDIRELHQLKRELETPELRSTGVVRVDVNVGGRNLYAHVDSIEHALEARDAIVKAIRGMGYRSAAKRNRVVLFETTKDTIHNFTGDVDLVAAAGRSTEYEALLDPQIFTPSPSRATMRSAVINTVKRLGCTATVKGYLAVAFNLKGVKCAACGRKIKQAIKGLRLPEMAYLNLTRNVLSVRVGDEMVQETLTNVHAVLRSIGIQAQVMQPTYDLNDDTDPESERDLNLLIQVYHQLRSSPSSLYPSPFPSPSPSPSNAGRQIMALRSESAEKPSAPPTEATAENQAQEEKKVNSCPPSPRPQPSYEPIPHGTMHGVPTVGVALRVTGINCLFCASLLQETMMAVIPGVVRVVVDFPARMLYTEYDTSQLTRDDLLVRLRALGHEGFLVQEGQEVKQTMQVILMQQQQERTQLPIVPPGEERLAVAVQQGQCFLDEVNPKPRRAIPPLSPKHYADIMMSSLPATPVFGGSSIPSSPANMVLTPPARVRFARDKRLPPALDAGHYSHVSTVPIRAFMSRETADLRRQRREESGGIISPASSSYSCDTPRDTFLSIFRADGVSEASEDVGDRDIEPGDVEAKVDPGSWKGDTSGYFLLMQQMGKPRPPTISPPKILETAAEAATLLDVPRTPRTPSTPVLYFEDKFTVWFDVTCDKAKGPKDEQRILGSFDTVHGFWSYWNNLNVQQLKDGCNLRLFRHNVPPQWDHPVNKEGGIWSARSLNKELRFKLWTEIVLALVGEQLKDNTNHKVCGVCLCTKPGGDKIEVWVDGGYSFQQATNSSAVPPHRLRRKPMDEFLRDLLFPGEEKKYFFYQSHQDYIEQRKTRRAGKHKKQQQNAAQKTQPGQAGAVPALPTGQSSLPPSLTTSSPDSHIPMNHYQNRATAAAPAVPSPLQRPSSPPPLPEGNMKSVFNPSTTFDEPIESPPLLRSFPETSRNSPQQNPAVNPELLAQLQNMQLFQPLAANLQALLPEPGQFPPPGMQGYPLGQDASRRFPGQNPNQARFPMARGPTGRGPPTQQLGQQQGFNAVPGSQGFSPQNDFFGQQRRPANPEYQNRRFTPRGNGQQQGPNQLAGFAQLGFQPFFPGQPSPPAQHDMQRVGFSSGQQGPQRGPPPRGVPGQIQHQQQPPQQQLPQQFQQRTPMQNQMHQHQLHHQHQQLQHQTQQQPLPGQQRPFPIGPRGRALGQHGGRGPHVEQVHQFLTELHLDEYFSVLEANGYDDMRSLFFLSEDDLQQMDFKPGHRKRLLAALAGRMA
eukprot:TRINITY_DN3532_c0_g1_i1.p1 TRINITY_DN3532_c0_g1~~TRINITY_DN3532_c0_g1_i1.p1  ORF type:complete len:1477 (-),score=233.86 TRINITY_DN3532_c0_g1_i1:276-4706(-)